MLDLYHFQHVYNSSFNFTIEQSSIESWLKGEGFDNDEPYSITDQENLKRDLNDLSQEVIPLELLKHQRSKEQSKCIPKLFLVTAGAPGAGKTKLLYAQLQKRHQLGEMYCYVCPDEVCLKRMRRTYNSMRSFLNHTAPEDAMMIAKRCYNKWRPASNAAAQLILAHLLQGRYPIAFGSTSTSNWTGRTFSFVKSLGYNLEILFVSAPPQVRQDSVRERSQRFSHCSELDLYEKEHLLNARILDSYLPYADTINFYWREHLHQEAMLVARWRRPDATAPGDSKSEHRTCKYNTVADFFSDESAIEIFHRAAFDALVKQQLLQDPALEKEALLSPSADLP